MTTSQVREILGEEYISMPEETVSELIQLIQSVCAYVLAIEDIEDQTDRIDHENHVPT